MLRLGELGKSRWQVVLGIVKCNFCRRALTGDGGEDLEGITVPQQWILCTSSVTLVETANAHAVPRTASTLMVVL